MGLSIVGKLKNNIRIESESDLSSLCEEVINEVKSSGFPVSSVQCCEAFDYLVLSAIKFYKGKDGSLASLLEWFASEDFSRNGLTPWGDYSRGIASWAQGDF